MNDLKPTKFLAGMAELPKDCSVQLQLVDLAGDFPGTRTVAVWIGIGCEDILMRAWRDANSPSNAQVVVGFQWLEIVVEYLIPIVGAIGHPNVSLPIDLQPMREVELPGFFARFLAA